MKQLYACDKCGKVFEDYEEAYKHEYFHYSPEVEEYDYVQHEFLGLPEKAMYIEGEAEPSIIHIRMKRYNLDTGKEEYRFGKYRLISTYAAPLTIVNDEKEGE